MNFERDGFALHRKVFSTAELEGLRSEAQRVTSQAKSVCVRLLEEHSEVFSQLSVDSRLRALIPSHLQPVRSILFDKTLAEDLGFWVDSGEAVWDAAVEVERLDLLYR